MERDLPPGRPDPRRSRDLPLAVISSSERDPRDPDGSKRQRARSRFYEGWIELQRELAALSSGSIHVVAARSQGTTCSGTTPNSSSARSPALCAARAIPDGSTPLGSWSAIGPR